MHLSAQLISQCFHENIAIHEVNNKEINFASEKCNMFIIDIHCACVLTKRFKGYVSFMDVIGVWDALCSV